MNETQLLGAIAAAPDSSYEARVAVVLAALERHDAPTRHHSTSVAAWSRRIAHALDLARTTVTFVERCALLHDIGKLFVPTRIFNKPGPLTPEEWISMRAHSAGGAAFLEMVPAFRAYAGVVRSHHERYDGCGYPDGLCGDSIPIESRIIAVADSFDAMIGVRSYRASLAPRAALDELRRCRETQFEAAIVDCLITIVQPRGRETRRDSFRGLRA